MRFAIFTHVNHQYREGKYFAYAPYVREMNIWLQILNSDFGLLYSELVVEVVAPLEPDPKNLGGLAYEQHNISFTKIQSFNLLSFGEIFSAISKIPTIFFKMIMVMRKADHLHLRCPGNIGLLACIGQIFFPRKPKTTKYAGNWDPEAKQPWTYKLQRWILSNRFLTRNMQVLVYGVWPEQSEDVKPFFTASFSEKAILKIQEKRFEEPYIFLFVGNLVPGKGIKIALRTMLELQVKGVDCKMEIYGNGPEREAAETYVKEAGVEGIQFKGNRNLEELEEAYQRGHFVILPSTSEGWPKAVAEGMYFGCIPIVTPVSCVPWMVGPPQPPIEGRKGVRERGILIEQMEIDKNLDYILVVLRDKERMQQMSNAAKEWSQDYTLERFKEGIREVLKKESRRLKPR